MKLPLKIRQRAVFTTFSIILLLVTWLAVLTHINRNITNANFIITLAIEYHLWLMVALVAISVSFGFYWSYTIYGEVERKRKESRSIMDIVLLFLHNEEREIINYLVQSKGHTNQSEISRLPGMNRVRAYRALQKMKEKQLIDIIPHGKIRKIHLRDNIYRVLTESSPKAETKRTSQQSL